ncbi:hypothetical protein KQX54_009010 [Cotesia glomerata]|uniref:PHD-type domain-containing protein n=1 Tax=Cotesia glomerata TaxID=32391 RepID=A0AAV7I2E5_COTGL|nr:hypothetical protein KQX54_009010 [Cotesia glomerata]
MASTKRTFIGCSKIIKENAGSINCYKCNQWFHKKCSKISDFLFKKYNAEYKKTGEINWKCETCQLEVSIESDSDDGDDEEAVPGSMPTVTKQIEQLFKQYLEPFAQRMKSLETNVAGIRSELNKIADQNKASTKQLEKRISVVENKIKSGFDITVSPDSIMSGIAERQKSESKVIVLNVPESKKPTGSDRLQYDREKVATLIPQELSHTLPKIKISRLGKPAEGKTHTVSYIGAKYPNSKILVTGDFNLPSSHPIDECEALLYNEMTLASCTQLNTVRNTYDRLLDLCFCSTNAQVMRAEPILDEDAHHLALLIHIVQYINLK